MYEIKEVTYGAAALQGSTCVLGADIGGTNSNFGIFQHQNGVLTLLLSLHIQSQTIVQFSDAVFAVVALLKKKYAITLASACFAVAGVSSEKKDFAQPTNLPWSIDAQEIKQRTGLQSVVVNDFIVIGYGINLIAPEQLVCVKQGMAWQTGNRAIIGAGTGLGKAIMVWHAERQQYEAVASEGGHADFAAHTAQDLALIQFIQQSENFTHAVSWEEVLSGKGIRRIYNFLGTVKNYPTNSSYEDLHLHPDKIFADRTKDARCFDTYALYAQYYARCVKSFALDALALGGVYIAGGIAAKNGALFEQDIFQQEFLDNGKQQQLLQNMPLWVITDYNVSMYGAAQYAVQQ